MLRLPRDYALVQTAYNHGNNGLLSSFAPIGGAGVNQTNPQYNPIPGSDEIRLTAPDFAPGTTDGMISGPNPRTISNIVSSGDQANVNDPTRSAWDYVFGQFVDHDLDLTNQTGNDISITVPGGDPFYPDGTVIPISRGQADPNNNNAAVNSVSGWLDLSQLYGSDTATAANLRTTNGHLKTSSGDNLPIVNGQFVSGDVRVMENPELTAATTLFLREHNFQVDRLAALHPNWSGDQLYNMAKAITTGEYQNILYTEFLPSIVGSALPTYQGYNANADPRIMEEFSIAAYRFGHSIVSNQETKIDNQGNALATQTLGQAFTDTISTDLGNGGLNALLRDFSNDASQANDVYAVDGLRNQLIAPPDAVDLIATDIQRERDLGIGSLNQTREALGLPAYTSFIQVTADPTVAANLQAAYGTIDQLDLFIGGLAEDHVNGGDLGQTFNTIVAMQFENLRDGDPYWWQNEGFDPTTLAMISNTTLSDLIMRDAGTPDMQANAFVTTERHSSDVAAADPTVPQLVIGTDAPGVVIMGGTADDTLVAGTGANQTLTGRNGSDVFVFDGTGHTGDTISDFNTNFDQIEFHGNAPAGAPVHVSDGTGGSVVMFNGNSITLSGISASSVSQSNLSFLDGNANPTQHTLLVS